MSEDGARNLDQMPEQSNFSKLAGIEVLSVTPELVVSQMKVTEAHSNRNGVLHGGALMTLADNAAGSAAFINIPADKSNTTIESKTNFLRGVRVGDTVTARCETIHRGRTMLVFQITMSRSDGKTAAVTTQTHLVLDWSDDQQKEKGDEMSETEPAAMGPQAMYEKFLAEGRFMIQRSKSTGQYVFYPRVTTSTGATDLEWTEAAGTGTVYAITVNRSRDGSNNVALIDLDEGVRMMSTLPEVETAPIGARVKARIEDAGDAPRVVFDLVSGDAA
ncbi:hotdog fold thioesterase [Rhodobacteraceae bacterium NNCM2]|nr:hotdog fold thioesterase [Coraliihabitans acroporae]